jgi:hypothetical protein
LWCQFRRDQITALVRKIYLCAIDIKPQIKLSVASIFWSPGPDNELQWTQRSAAYNNVFQDWRSWMEEGIVDFNMPMLYVPYRLKQQRDFFTKSTTFAKSHRYNRHVIISPAIYLNSVSDSLEQIEVVRKIEADGKGSDGIALYSYARCSKDKVPRKEFLSALTGSKREDGRAVRYFATPVPTPEMSWKTKPTTGHLKGFVFGAEINGVDGATIALKGPKEQTIMADATGFYGAVDLPPGEYSLSASFGGQKSTAKSCTISLGKVASIDLHLKP